MKERSAARRAGCNHTMYAHSVCAGGCARPCRGQGYTPRRHFARERRTIPVETLPIGCILMMKMEREFDSWTSTGILVIEKEAEGLLDGLLKGGVGQ